MTGVCCAKAFAIIIFWHSPSLSVATVRAASGVMPTCSMLSSTTRLSSPPSLPQKPVYGVRPSETTSLTVMLSASGRVVSTTPIILDSSSAEYPARSLPFIYICPPSTGWNAASVLSSVDLPAPFWPMRHVSSPSRRVASMPLATVLHPPFWR